MTIGGNLLDHFAQAVLAAASIAYLFFGFLCLAYPHTVTDSLGLLPTTPLAHVELRSVYGGLEIGFGLFFALCALNLGWVNCGLAAMVTTFGCILAVRIPAAVTHGARGRALWMLLLIEGSLFAAALAVAVWRWMSRTTEGIV